MVIVDSAAARMLDLIDGQSSPRLLSVVEKSLPQAELNRFRELLLQLKTCAAEFAAQYRLGKQQRDERQVLVAETSHIWTVLENCRPAKMRGYGAIPEPDAKRLEGDVEDMLAVVEQLRRVLVLEAPSA